MGRYSHIISDILDNQSPSFSNSFSCCPSVQESSNISIIDGLSSDDESVNNEKSCPPPPPPPPPPSQPVHSVEQQAQQAIEAIQCLYKRHVLCTMAQYVLDARTRRKERIQNLQNISVARQFHNYVILLRYFIPWMERARYRKQQVRIHGLLLKKILYVWNAESGREVQKRRSAETIKRIFTAIPPGGGGGVNNADCGECGCGDGGLVRRVLSCAIQRWSEYCWVSRFASKVFVGWRLRARIQSFRCSMAEEKVVILSIHNCKRLVLRAWREHRLIKVLKERTGQRILMRVFGTWKTAVRQAKIEEEILTKPRILTFQKNQCRRDLWRAFQQLRHYTLKRTHYRWAYQNIQTKYHQRLLRASTEQWKDYRILCIRRQRMLRIIILRQYLHRWLHSAKGQRQKEYIMLQIIVNRWRIYTEERLERRMIRKISHEHWCNYMYGIAFRAWKSTVIIERGRIRTPIFSKSLPMMKKKRFSSDAFVPAAGHILGTTASSPLNSTRLRKRLSRDAKPCVGRFRSPGRNSDLSRDSRERSISALREANGSSTLDSHVVKNCAGIFRKSVRNIDSSRHARERSFSALRGLNASSTLDYSREDGCSTQSDFSSQGISAFRAKKSPFTLIGHASKQGRCLDSSQEKSPYSVYARDTSHPIANILNRSFSPTNKQGNDGFCEHPSESYKMTRNKIMMPPSLHNPPMHLPPDLQHLVDWRDKRKSGDGPSSKGFPHSMHTRPPLEDLSRKSPSRFQNQMNHIPLDSRRPSWGHDADSMLKGAATGEAKYDNDTTPIRQAKYMYQRRRHQGEVVAEQKWASSPWNEKK